MQCAYQRAVGAIEQPCQQCTELESAWFGRNNSLEDPCNITCGWLRTSKQWRDVPKCCRNRYGSHCGVYVWVDPCQTEEFSRLVLLMIEYATGKYYPKDIAKTTVQFYVNSDMSPGSKDNHSTVITVEGNDEISVAELRDKFGITLALAKDKSAAYALIDDILKSGKASKTDVDNIKSSLNKGSRKLDFLDNIEGSKVLDLSELQKFKAIQEELNQERSGLLQETPAALPPTRTPIDFGPPTQFNSILGGGILQLRQQLDAGRRSE
jgi:hypothetical protein